MTDDNRWDEWINRLKDRRQYHCNYGWLSLLILLIILCQTCDHTNRLEKIEKAIQREVWAGDD